MPRQPSLSQTVARLLQGTGPGDVLTYGQLARMAGRPGAARAVGRIMAESHGLPWWRVVTARGRLVPGAEERQAELLAAEGVALEGGLRAARPGRPGE